QCERGRVELAGHRGVDGLEEVELDVLFYAVGDERGAAVGVDGLGRLLGAADDLRDTTGVIEEDDGAGAGDRPVDHADVAASVEQVLVGQHTDLVGGYHHLFAVLVDARDGRLATLAGQH